MADRPSWSAIKRTRKRTAARRDGYRRAKEAFELAQRVRRARERLGMTQAELASRIGSTQPAVARLEAGGVTPSPAALRRVAGGPRFTEGQVSRVVARESPRNFDLRLGGHADDSIDIHRVVTTEILVSVIDPVPECHELHEGVGKRRRDEHSRRMRLAREEPPRERDAHRPRVDPERLVDATRVQADAR